MRATDLTRAITDPSHLMRLAGTFPDPWQTDFLRTTHPQTMLLVTRQGGKSHATAALATHTILFKPQSTTIILSPGQRQSTEIFHRVMKIYRALGRPIAAEYESQMKLELKNGSRIICLPGKEETVRAYSPDLIIIDEAARVPDELYLSVRPMLAATKGRLVALSTPFGRRGWFYNEWQNNERWKKIRVAASSHPRLGPDFVANEKKSMGENWVRQEYECEFTAMAGLVYPDMVSKCVYDFDPSELAGIPVGGIDWGWRNPFAAIWGKLDSDDHLWIFGERYKRQTPLTEHAAALPRDTTYYADPAGRTEIEEMRIAGHIVRRGANTIEIGINAVNRRIAEESLSIHPSCKNLVDEAQLYRYPNDSEVALMGEKPIDEHNHALAALRYLISRIDARKIAAARPKDEEKPEPTKPKEEPKPESRIWQFFREEMWEETAL